jgi:hypothetical protein
MKVFIANLGEVVVTGIFLCGSYKYGYAKGHLVRYDYVSQQWEIAC